MIPILNIAIRAVRKVENLIIKGFEEINNISNLHNDKYKINCINKIHYLIENNIIKTILLSYPKHCIFSKKSGYIKSTNQSIQWIIDSINGIVNYTKGFPHFAISIAIKIKNKIEVSIIYDVIKNEIFSAIRGNNAQLNGYRLRVKNTKKLEHSIIGSNFINFNKNILNKSIYLRNTGVPSLDLAYLSSGRYDCYIGSNLKIWDIAAGELLVRESGGIITDFQGNNDYILSGNVIAGNAKIVKQLLVLINKKIF